MGEIPYLRCDDLYSKDGDCMDCMECIECGKKIDVLAEICPYCGEKQYDEAVEATVSNVSKRQKQDKHPMFSEEECLVYGIHPKDEMYRKTMELNVLSKSYK